MLIAHLSFLTRIPRHTRAIVPRRQPLPPLTHRQLEIMDVIWQRGETTVGEVWTELARSRKIARNTVQTTVTRLEEKGWLSHRAAGQTFYYRASRPGDDDRRRMAIHLVDTVFDGSPAALLQAVLDLRPLSPDEADRLRHVIDQSVIPR